MAQKAKSPTPEDVREVIEPITASVDLFCEDVTISGPPNRLVVRVVLDLHEDDIGGLSLDRVAEVSRPISDALDAKELFRGAYNLEVSSPGANRPLTELRHFKRARTRLVQISLQAGDPVLGRLQAVEGDVIILETAAGETERIEFADVVQGAVEVELRRMADVDLDSVSDDEDEEH